MHTSMFGVWKHSVHTNYCYSSAVCLKRLSMKSTWCCFQQYWKRHCFYLRNVSENPSELCFSQQSNTGHCIILWNQYTVSAVPKHCIKTVRGNILSAPMKIRENQFLHTRYGNMRFSHGIEILISLMLSHPGIVQKIHVQIVPMIPGNVKVSAWYCCIKNKFRSKLFRKTSPDTFQNLAFYIA